jgi:GntR family transcriptional repressor for pyruvate dehydrogenase complex
VISIQLEIVEQQNVSERVFDQFIGMLHDGDWKPGDKIPSENSLSLSLGVSRITVRGALHKLESLGLVEGKKNGRYVCESGAAKSVQSLMPEILLERPPDSDMFSFRHLLEMGSIPLAIEAGTSEDLALMRNILERIMECAPDNRQLETLDVAFHTSLGNMTGNSILKKIYQSFRTMLFYFKDGYSNYEETVELYSSFLGCMENKDVEGAKAAMNSYLEMIKEAQA